MSRRSVWTALLAASVAISQPSPASTQRRGSPPPSDLRRLVLLAAEENRGATLEERRVLVEGAHADDPVLQAAAIRALGRFERRDVIAHLLPLMRGTRPQVRDEVANAIAQSFRGEPLTDSSAAEQVQVAFDALRSAGGNAVYRSIGRLPYETVDQVRAAEEVLRTAIDPPRPSAGAARGLESLARLRGRLSPIDEATVDSLREIASRRMPAVDREVRLNAMAALVAAQGADASTLRAALQDEEFQVRRLATLVLAGAGATLTMEERLGFLNTALQDRSAQERLEAIRSWARHAARDHGCVPLVNALNDVNLHVVLAALDALGDQCKDNEPITDALTAEARTPPTVGRWQREAHAFVALAKRSRERAVIAMPAFLTHAEWQVRLYAVRAAIALDDTVTLLRLAADPDDNVVEAALPPLRRRLGRESDAVFVAALDRRTRTAGRKAPPRPYQVIRTAAIQLKGAEATPALLNAIVAALQRITAERCQTSRDARLALIDRLAEFGSSAQAEILTPLLRDIDPRVAAAAASVLSAWSGRPVKLEPQERQPDLPTADALAEPSYVKVEMETGRSFTIGFYAEQAPLAASRFLRLVRDHYYDGLSFHRIVPNFVIQGGSPSANEYCGACPFMRDEVGLLMNSRGTIGISTRGRDTGDAQIFINLVDTPRLDHEYTVFAYVCENDMAVVDDIHEGERMQRLVVSSRLDCRPPSR